MNPFLKDPVAQPLGALEPSHWRAPQKRQRTSTIARHTSVAMMAAGLTVGLSAQAMDVNTASATQLESLRGIGPRTAKMIVHERTRAGAFVSLEDLSERVRGLGLRRVRALRQAGLEVRPAKSGNTVAAELTGALSEFSVDPKTMNRKSPATFAKPEIISP